MLFIYLNKNRVYAVYLHRTNSRHIKFPLIPRSSTRLSEGKVVTGRKKFDFLTFSFTMSSHYTNRSIYTVLPAISVIESCSVCIYSITSNIKHDLIWFNPLVLKLIIPCL